MHVHVQHAEGEAKCWLEPRIEVAENDGLSRRRLASALQLVRETRLKSAVRGRPTSDVEVTNVSGHGFWLLIDGRELFVPFKQFPWFREVSIGELCNVELPHPGHLHWPDLDVDLAIESVEHPKRFPLLSRVRPNKRLQPTAPRRRSG